MGAISHVLAGISPGLNRNHKVDMGEALGSYYEVASDLGVGETMDNLYVTTHSGDLEQSAVLVTTGKYDAAKYGDIGAVQTDASYAELTGDIDGYLLGSELSTRTAQELWGAGDLVDGRNTITKLSTYLHQYDMIPRSGQTPPGCIIQNDFRISLILLITGESNLGA